MMKVVLILLCFAIPAFAQNPSSDGFGSWTFKGYKLGMTLQEFRDVTPKVQATAFQSDSKNPAKLKKVTVTLPVCTDEYQGIINIIDPTGIPAPGVIVCETSVHGENKQSEMIAGVQPLEIEYQFWKSKLYQIYFRYKSEYFPVVLAAFIDKYGTPSSRTEETFQNGFGAKWTGAVVKWNQTGQGILLREGSHNGPGQSPDPLGFDGSTVNIVDGTALQDILKTVPVKKSDF